MRTHELGSTAPSTARAGVGFAGLTLVTHAANFGFVVIAGRLLDPGPFSDLVALLGIVLLGLAPGMAVQALTAAGVLGAPSLVDRALGRRLGNLIGVVVVAVTTAAWVVLSIGGWLVLVAIPVAAALLPRTAVNEGLLQGHGRFPVLGWVMVAGATAKLVLGWLGMATIGTVDVAAVAVLAGYVTQYAASTAGSHRHPAARGADADGAVRRAVGAMIGLLVVVHLDAVLAPAQLPALEAGRYATGVTAARITFWLPQFAVLLWFPRVVVDRTGRLVLAALLGVVGLGAIGSLGAVLLGPWLAETAFGPELGAIGPHLWRFVWIGAGALGLQVLTLADIAAGRRGASVLVGAAGVAVAAALLLTGPADAAAAAGVVAVPLAVAVAVGGGRAVVRARGAAG